MFIIDLPQTIRPWHFQQVSSGLIANMKTPGKNFAKPKPRISELVATRPIRSGVRHIRGVEDLRDAPRRSAPCGRLSASLWASFLDLVVTFLLFSPSLLTGYSSISDNSLMDRSNLVSSGIRECVFIIIRLTLYQILSALANIYAGRSHYESSLYNYDCICNSSRDHKLFLFSLSCYSHAYTSTILIDINLGMSVIKHYCTHYLWPYFDFLGIVRCHNLCSPPLDLQYNLILTEEFTKQDPRPWLSRSALPGQRVLRWGRMRPPSFTFVFQQCSNRYHLKRRN